MTLKILVKLLANNRAAYVLELVICLVILKCLIANSSQHYSSKS